MHFVSRSPIVQVGKPCRASYWVSIPEIEIVEHYANVAGDAYQPGATEIAIVARLLS